MRFLQNEHESEHVQSFIDHEKAGNPFDHHLVIEGKLNPKQQYVCFGATKKKKHVETSERLDRL